MGRRKPKAAAEPTVEIEPVAVEPGEAVLPVEAPPEPAPELPPEPIEVGHAIECPLEEVGARRARLCSLLPEGSMLSTRRAGKRATITVMKVG